MEWYASDERRKSIHCVGFYVNPFKVAFSEALNITDVVDAGGFAFINIKKRFSDLLQDRKVTVVGKYIENTKIVLMNGQTKAIPVLSYCYVKAWE